MKTNQVCPKCHAANIVHVPGQVGAFGAGNNVITGRTAFSVIGLGRYICAKCGFSEDWVDSSDDLARLVKKFKPEKL